MAVLWLGESLRAGLLLGLPLILLGLFLTTRAPASPHPATGVAGEAALEG